MMQNYGQVAAPLPTFSANIGGSGAPVLMTAALHARGRWLYIATIT